MSKSTYAILRDVTIAVKVAPFIIVFLYLLGITAYFFTDDATQTVIDTWLYVSPVFVGMLLILSHLLKMCIWHKIECMLPLVPQIVVLIDIFYQLDEIASKVNVAVVIFIFLLSILNAYMTFIRKNDSRPEENQVS